MSQAPSIVEPRKDEPRGEIPAPSKTTEEEVKAVAEMFGIPRKITTEQLVEKAKAGLTTLAKKSNEVLDDLFGKAAMPPKPSKEDQAMIAALKEKEQELRRSQNFNRNFPSSDTIDIANSDPQHSKAPSSQEKLGLLAKAAKVDLSVAAIEKERQELLVKNTMEAMKEAGSFEAQKEKRDEMVKELLKEGKLNDANLVQKAADVYIGNQLQLDRDVAVSQKALDAIGKANER